MEDFNICEWVDKKGVDQVWLWGYHTEKIVPAESNMSMGLLSRAFWNHGNYGDISNSFQTNDLPQCQRTYVLFNYNTGREYEMGVHNHGHQLERLFQWLNPVLYRALTPPLFQGSSFTPESIVCGNVHYTPLAEGPQDEYGYDKHSEKEVLSPCPYWRPGPDVPRTRVRCSDWGCTGRGFYVWWMNSLPPALWEAVSDLDTYLQKHGRTLEYGLP